MSRNIKTANHISYDCSYHIVWTTKYRLPLLVEGADDRLKTIIKEVVEEFNGEIVELEVMPDHVHVLLSCYPHILDKIVRSMKGRSSRLLREEFSFVKSRTPSLWSRSYFVATTGGVNLSVIKKYVESQKLRVK